MAKDVTGLGKTAGTAIRNLLIKSSNAIGKTTSGAEYASRYYVNSAFKSKDGKNSGYRMNAVALYGLDKLTERIGKRLSINSGYRSPGHNAEVGGASKSQHMYGNAIDVSVSGTGLTVKQLAQYAREIGFTGIGIYSNFVHMDVGPPRTWSG